MSENISAGPTMSDVSSPRHDAENTSTPHTSWVQFDETDGKPEDDSQRSSSAGGTPIRKAGSSSQTTTTSGVSSARGSVNSLTQQNHANSSNSVGSPEGAHISVSEIQVGVQSMKKCFDAA